MLIEGREIEFESGSWHKARYCDECGMQLCWESSLDLSDVLRYFCWFCGWEEE